MFDARISRRTLPLLLIALATTGCTPGLHSVRLRTPDGRERTVVPRPHPPVVVTEEEFRRATASLARNIVPVADPLELARQQFELPVRSGWFFFNPHTKQITPLDPAAAADFLPAEVVELTRSYLQWCHNRQEPGDCLRLLQHGYALDADARLAVAMDIALGSVMEAVAANLEGIIANRVAVRAMLVTGVAMYGLLLVAPEPITKVLAVMMTAALVAYLGMDTIFSLRDGWRRLVARADAATTFDELRSAGEQFGKLMGANTTRILVMVTAAAMGSAAGGVAKTMATLPEAGEALSFAAEDGVVVEVVHTITIAEPSLIITLAPGAVAMSTIRTNSGVGSTGGRRPSREERIAELMKDKDRGMKPDDKTTRREAEVAVDMEDQGRLKGPVRRPKEGDGHSGDFVDRNGQDWDVKRPHSRAQLEEIKRLEAINEGRPPPKFDPNRPLRGQFELKETLRNIHEEFAKGENVIVDTSKLNEADVASLRRTLTEEGILGTKVLMYP